MNESENTTTQNLWDAVKAVLSGRFIAIPVCLKKQEKNKIHNRLWGRTESDTTEAT